jgi:Lon protease-like protein
MDELPLFPLNTVLFPGTPLSLHIFEERYKRMIQVCLENDQTFGVVLIRRGLEANGPLADPFSIGCTAKIVQVQPLSNGRMNILATGQERFRILILEREKFPYLVGAVAPYPLGRVSLDILENECDHLGHRVRHYLKMLAESGVFQIDETQIPSEPISLAYTASALLQVSPIQKQQLLSIHDDFNLLKELNKLYRREIIILKSLLIKPDREQGPFSNN